MNGAAGTATISLIDGTTVYSLPTFTYAAATMYTVQMSLDGKGSSNTMRGWYQSRGATTTSDWTAIGSKSVGAAVMTTNNMIMGPVIGLKAATDVAPGLKVGGFFVAIEKL
jgi:hypothetical protein